MGYGQYRVMTMVKESDYSKRELRLMFDRVHEQLDDQKKLLDEILKQAKLTNGRVTLVEKEQVKICAKVDLHHIAIIGVVVIIVSAVIVGVLKLVGL